MTEQTPAETIAHNVVLEVPAGTADALLTTTLKAKAIGVPDDARVALREASERNQRKASLVYSWETVVEPRPITSWTVQS